MNLTIMPNQTETADDVQTLRIPLIALRNEALKQNDFESAVLLSHVHAWLFWIEENMTELKKELSKTK
jgi:hypothetical protein